MVGVNIWQRTARSEITTSIVIGLYCKIALEAPWCIVEL